MPDKKRRERSKHRPTAFGIGLIALDLVVSSDPNTPVRAWAGGTCGNVLAILSFLGWDSYPIARLNGDAASRRVKADLRRWGVHFDHAECGPPTDTPIIVQEIRRAENGVASHRFRWVCPHCGSWLPGYRAVTLKGAETVAPQMTSPSVFFMDRLSPASVELADAAAKRGALVVFEPSSKNDERLLESALQIVHVVKYSEQRFSLGRKGRPGPSVLLEINTLGERGLRFRSWASRSPSQRWEHLPSVAAPLVVDTCGSGDWCTAGVVSRIAAAGLKGLDSLSDSSLRAALRFGQALAAWNCGFEGARGGMYQVREKAFADQIRQLLRGVSPVVSETTKSQQAVDIRCPACPA